MTNTAVPVSSVMKYCIPPQHEIAERESDTLPPTNTTAFIESRIVSADYEKASDIPKAFRRMVVARTVYHWSTFDKTKKVQIANPSNRHVYLKMHTLLWYISPVEAVLTTTMGRIRTDDKNITQTRGELSVALKKSVRKRYILTATKLASTRFMQKISNGIFVKATRTWHMHD